jgi:DNA repair exonuclease SbcCD ATPase subunit
MTVNNSLTSEWDADDALRREMERLEASRQFAAGNGLTAASSDPFAVAAPALSDLDPLAVADNHLHRPPKSSPLPGPFAGGGFAAAGAASAELDKLQLENEELHKLVEEMKQIFAQASEQEAENVKTIEALKVQSAELAGIAADKDRRIEALTAQIKELEVQVKENATPPPPPSEDELSRMADELEKERCQLTRDRKSLDEERAQVRDDEEDMMRQMREMEVQMAKERAEMARQRTELQRLHGDIKRELEVLQGSDRALADRLVQFQRRHHDLQHRAGLAPTPTPVPVSPQTAAATPLTPKKDSGLFQRFFGRK